ncbi:MAG: O-antigen ligase family protein [Pseudomonadales bacterium]
MSLSKPILYKDKFLSTLVSLLFLLSLTLHFVVENVEQYVLFLIVFPLALMCTDKVTKVAPYERLFIASCLFFFIAAIPQVIVSQQGEALDAPSRFLLGALVIYLSLHKRIDPKVIEWSPSLSLIITFPFAYNESSQVSRIATEHGIIETGQIASILTVISVFMFLKQIKSLRMSIHLLAVVSGFFIVAMSGTKIAFFSLFFCVILAVFLAVGRFTLSSLILSLLVSVIVFVGFYSASSSLAARVDQAFSSLYAINDGLKADSTGIRLAYIVTSLEGFSENPLLGVSYDRQREIREEIENRYGLKGKLKSEQTGHVSTHNEYFYTAIDKGLIGLLALFSVYFSALVIFLKAYKRYKLEASLGFITLLGFFMNAHGELVLLDVNMATLFVTIMCLLINRIRFSSS